MNKIRYIAVHPLNDFSGSPRVLADFCASDEVQSHSLTIVTSASNGFLYAGLGEMKTIWYGVSGSQLVNIFFFLCAQLQLFTSILWLIARSRLRRERVIVINNTILCFGSIVASRLAGALTVAYLHELSTGHSWPQRLTRKIAERVIQFTAHEVLFVSQFLSDQYRLRYRQRTVLPNGLRSDFAQVPHFDYDAKFANGNVLFVGSLRAYKGIDELLEIASALPNTPFTGIFSSTNSELERFSRSISVPDNLTLIARAPDIEEKYREAFLVLNLSLPKVCVEGFALTILEGLSTGCPCVVPLTGGHLDYFDEGAGIMLDARDTRAIVHFIEQLQRDEPRWRGYSDRALEIAQGYSAQIYQQRVGEFLREIQHRHFSP